MKIIKQIAPGNRNGMKSLSYEFESIIYSNVKENYPQNWTGGLITTSLLSDLKKLFHGKSIHTPGNTLTSFWRLYRLKDEHESIFSDVAFIVQVSYHDGQTVRGAVFHDTAEKDAGKNTFAALNKNKFRKILSVSPHAGIILYDYDAITGMAFPSTAESVIGSHPHNWNTWLPYTHAVAVPAGLALAMDSKTTGLYKISLPLSYQICYRYLYGLDLDHSAQALDIAAGIKEVRGNPKMLVLIAVSHGGMDPMTSFDIDTMKYSEFE